MRRWLFAVVLAGCGSDGPKYDPPPPEAVASCALVAKRPDADTARHELWFDSAGRMIQADGFHGTSTFAYDDQGRPVRAAMSDGNTFTWTYDPSRITAVTTGKSSYTEIYDLDPDGRLMHFDAVNSHVDFMHDDAGHLTSISDPSRHYMFTYDSQGRLASSYTDASPLSGPTTYSYNEGPAGIEIDLSGDFQRTYTYDFDGAGRVIRAAIDGAGYNYSYDGDRITAIADDVRFETDSEGVCPGLTTTLMPFDPVPIRISPDTATLPNGPIDDFGEYGY